MSERRQKGLQEKVAEIKDPVERFWAMRRAINLVNGRVLLGTVVASVIGGAFFISMFSYPENSELVKQQQENLRLIEEAKRKREAEKSR